MCQESQQLRSLHDNDHENGNQRLDRLSISSIRVGAQALVHRAFTIVPEKIAKETLPGIFENIVLRMRRFYENAKPEDD